MWHLHQVTEIQHFFGIMFHYNAIPINIFYFAYLQFPVWAQSAKWMSLINNPLPLLLRWMFAVTDFTKISTPNSASNRDLGQACTNKCCGLNDSNAPFTWRTQNFLRSLKVLPLQSACDFLLMPTKSPWICVSQHLMDHQLKDVNKHIPYSTRYIKRKYLKFQ